ncbi:carbonic anhydrase [Micromonospora deserti]|uniref:Carbonic anhydrase n=1 Tax=Micromonospora deserti TaxID=2070366 RepID=A0A2W2DNP0_9ACTN|nr:carbonic anhydrase [Micromonospora deserti]PZG02510.1 hypothetical protein C1I99_01980 [Micromonospora deserti]
MVNTTSQSLALNRRNLLRLGGLLVGSAGSAAALAGCGSGDSGGTSAGSAASTTNPVSHKEKPVTSPEEALDRLLEGNARFVSGQFEHPNLSPGIRAELAQGQHPFAQVLTCSDSRVAPELVFDRGLGDLFVERNAGNIPDPVTVGSMQYAVQELGAPLILVLGHQKCGAVTAAVEAVEKHSEPTGTDLDSIIDAIRPAVEKVKENGGDLVDHAVRQHVANVVAKLRTNPVIGAAVKSGKLRVVGGRYALDSGRVEIIVQ